MINFMLLIDLMMFKLLIEYLFYIILIIFSYGISLIMELLMFQVLVIVISSLFRKSVLNILDII